MSSAKTIVWFRQDLRIHDNPALLAAVEAGDVLPIYILDDVNSGEWSMGEASRLWLHQSLASLNESLDGQLCFFNGDAETILVELVATLGATAVCWNRCYEPWRISRDRKIKSLLTEQGIHVSSHNGSLLWEPWEITKKDGTPYKVYSPYFKRGCLGATDRIRQALPAPKKIAYMPRPKTLVSASLDDLSLLPSIPWDASIRAAWPVGETAAHDKLQRLIDRRLAGYKKGRDFPAMDSTSRLSPHLHFGELSPHQVWFQVLQSNPDNEEDLSHYQSELGWREFSYYLLYHWPELPDQPFMPKYKAFPWRSDNQGLEQWQQGKTGYPIVDAGMRELWQTGYMHNRVRMIVGSFLVKNQLVHWRDGERWFWNCLVDADLASNSAGWQWVAGCGADASPYFRIFNPLLQSEKFDPEGEYLVRYLPELKNLPKKFRHKPWEAPAEVLTEAGVELGKDYPVRILDLKVTRERALASLRAMNDQLAAQE
mgnify:CR=1 FL=1